MIGPSDRAVVTLTAVNFFDGIFNQNVKKNHIELQGLGFEICFAALID